MLDEGLVLVGQLLDLLELLQQLAVLEACLGATTVDELLLEDVYRSLAAEEDDEATG